MGEIPVLRWFRALVRKAMGESPENREKKEKLYQNIQKQRGRKETSPIPRRFLLPCRGKRKATATCMRAPTKANFTWR